MAYVSSCFYFVPLFPPNFQGDIDYANETARMVSRYSKFGEAAPPLVNDLEGAFYHFQDNVKSKCRSAAVGDLLIDKVGDIYMVANDGFMKMDYKMG